MGEKANETNWQKEKKKGIKKQEEEKTAREKTVGKD